MAEGKKFLLDHAKAHKIPMTEEMLKEAKAMFNYVDTSDDGEIDAAEMGAAIEKHQAEYEAACN